MKNAPPGPRPKENVVPYSARFYESQWERMKKFREAAGVDFMAQIRAGVDMYLDARRKMIPDEEADSGKDADTITFTANEKERAALKQLADGLHIGDVDLTARIVSLRLASLDIEDVREMLFGDAKRALKEKIEAKAAARKKPVGDGNGIRKVA